MIYLLLAVVSSALVSVIMRLSTGKVKSGLGMLAMNYLTAFSLNVISSGSGFGNFGSAGFKFTLLFGLVNGVLYLGSFLSFQRCVGKNGVVLSAVFMKLGILVPVLMSICVFGESPSLLQVLGFVIAVAAIIIINSGSESQKGSFNLSLVFLLVMSGLADGSLKVFEQFCSDGLKNLFFTMTFLTAHCICLFSLLKQKEKIGLNEISFGCLIGIPNYMSSRFLLLSLQNMPAVIVYPTCSVATVLVVTLTGVAAFKEKLIKKQWLAMVMILAALVLLNV